MNPQMSGGWLRGCETPSAPSGLVPCEAGQFIGAGIILPFEETQPSCFSNMAPFMVSKRY